MKHLLKKGNIINKDFYCHWLCMILAGAGILVSSAVKAVYPFPLSFPEDIKAFKSIEGNKYHGNAEVSYLPVPFFDLTGFWEDDAGGKYQIRQVGNTVVWYDNRKPMVENVFIGTIEDNIILNGNWYDLPGGQLINNGSISFRIESNDRLVKINSSVYYLGTIITRTGGSTNGNCDLKGTWRHYIQGVGQSVFTFSPLGGGRYSLREEGLGNATGTATVNGNKVHLEWSSAQNGDAGYIDWEINSNCDTGLGNLVFTSGKTGTITDRIERISSITDTSSTDGGGICANPRTLQIMDEWLFQAIPPQKPTDYLRYESWGRLTGTTETVTLRPAGTPTTNLTRCEYLWQQANKLQSTNGLGTLLDYVLQHLK